MFDKNQFKVMFRRYVESHHQASDEEALAFARSIMPANVMASHYWLIDQSLQWFRWVKAQRALQASRENFELESKQSNLC